MSDLQPEIGLITKLELYFSIRNTSRSIRTFAELFDYDYDCVVIFLSVAEVCFQAAFHLAPVGYGPAEIEKIYAQVAAAGLSVMTIGEITGIPRETVRRKVKALIDDGYLAQAESGKTVYLPLSVVLSDRVLPKMQTQFNEALQFAKMVNFYQKPSEP
jgi:hypothetical protein